MIKLECELYAPAKEYFEGLGYTVDAEVTNCDLVAVKDDITVIAELKKSFNISLVYQLLERKGITPYVYAVIPRPKNFRARKVKQMLKLVKVLEVGLITVSEKTLIAEEIVPPVIDSKKIPVNYKRRKRVKNEFDKRSYMDNVGGVNKSKIMTAYRENSIAALCVTEAYEVFETRKVKDNIKKTVQSNHYNWFYRINKGVYGLTETGKTALKNTEYTEIITYYRNEVEKCLK